MVKGSLVAILMTALLVGCTGADLASSANRDSGGKSFSGYVYDIDFLNRPNQGWTQILIMPLSGGLNLVGQTDNPSVQDVLETALLDKLPAEVTYYETSNSAAVKILKATVSAAPIGCLENGCVKRVSCVSNGECSAQIYGEPREPKTDNLRALGVLLTAMNKKKAVEYLVLDNNNYIVRVKINVTP